MRHNVILLLMLKIIYIRVIGRLLSYAGEYRSVKTLTEQIRGTCTKTCHLVPLSSCFDIGGGEISRKNFNSPVWSLATSNASAGTLVICGLQNGSIIIYELETGMLSCGIT